MYDLYGIGAINVCQYKKIFLNNMYLGCVRIIYYLCVAHIQIIE